MRIVLVVDDEPVLRMLATEMLEDAGHIVVAFDTAAQAMAYCDVPANDVAAVVTDINMPGDMDGLDLARHVRATRPDASIVVTSGRYDTLPDDTRRGITFLPKPWTQDRLLGALGRIEP